ncbi:MAG: AAA family ATPase [Archangium sp.]|nr:AAA family ATPase [Archangium sp.]MDP3574707.1 AAA family ATPase [Archangium sp.]
MELLFFVSRLGNFRAPWLDYAMIFRRFDSLVQMNAAEHLGVSLVPDPWNDYGYRTTFSLFYRDLQGQHGLGSVKIATKRGDQTTVVPESFETLGDGYCTLGASSSVYARTDALLGRTAADQIWSALRDCHADATSSDGFQANPAFSESLLRFAPARLLLSSGRLPNYALNANPELRCSIRLNGFEVSHEVHLRFGLAEPISGNVVVLIGPSGVGKTGVLAKLATGLAGEEDDSVSWLAHPPAFSRICAASYGVMLPFKERVREASVFEDLGTNRIGVYSTSSAVVHFANTLGRIEELGLSDWSETEALLKDTLPEVPLTSLSPAADLATRFAAASAGHRMFATLITDLHLFVIPDSLILLDEPEIHLHPTLLTRLVHWFYGMLARRRALAVIATHSPTVVQSTLGKQVRILSRNGNRAKMSLPDRETLGSGVSELNDAVFRASGAEPRYLDALKSAIQGHGVAKVRESFIAPRTLELEVAIRSLA